MWPGGGAEFREANCVYDLDLDPLDRICGVGASVSHPVPRLGPGFKLRRRVRGTFMPARRRADRLVDRGLWDVPPGGWVGRLSRPLGGGSRGVGRPVGLVQPRLPCERQRPAPCARQDVGGVGPEASDGRRGVASEVSTQPLLHPPGGAGVGYPPARREEVDTERLASPPHII
jgi:hypothetical protein